MIEIIPAMDLIDGKCVRLMQGDFAQKTIYSDDPLETAKRFEAAGLRRLHMVDLDGARAGSPANLKVLEKVAKGTDLVIDFSGGLKTDADVSSVFDAGAAIAAIGSVAVQDPELLLSWIAKFGGEKILIGADCRDEKVAINGWQGDTTILVIEFLADLASRGVTHVFVTDIARDGAMNGPSFELYRRIKSNIPRLGLIASGGVSCIGDIDELERIGCSGAIVGKAIYEQNIKIQELAKYAG